MEYYNIILIAMYEFVKILTYCQISSEIDFIYWKKLFTERRNNRPSLQQNKSAWDSCQEQGHGIMYIEINDKNG